MISPQKFWKHILRPKIINTCVEKPWKEKKTKLILSVTDRKTSKITKEFPKLDVNWSFVARQLQDWSKFLNGGKTITATFVFYFDSVDNGKPGRGGATANQEADLEARTAGLGRGACIRKAYALMRCPGRPCTKGDHCWQHEGMHYPLRPHHVRMLADHIQAGKPLNGHDDVPEEFRRLVVDDQREQEERQRRERDKTQNRKRRRRESNDSLSIATGSCHHDTPDMAFPTSPLELDLSNDDAIRAYSVWHRTRVSSEQKGYYDEIEALTLANCFTLDMIASNQNNMYRFYISERVPKGVAWSYVCYIQYYLKQRERAQSI